MLKLPTERFWLVWNPNGRSPTFRHHSRQSATTEAERLANQNPGLNFFILEAVAGRLAPIGEAAPIEFVEPDPSLPAF